MFYNTPNFEAGILDDIPVRLSRWTESRKDYDFWPVHQDPKYNSIAKAQFQGI